MRIGIMSAMEEEKYLLLNHLENPYRVDDKGLRTYCLGKLWDIETVLTCSRWGKVAAAVTATQLILDYKIDCLILTGVAGAADPTLGIGDIVLAQKLVQYDLDARPLFDRFEIPYLGEKSFYPTPPLAQMVKRAVINFLDQYETHVPTQIRDEFRIQHPRFIEGTIGSSDQFCSDKNQLQELRQKLPDVSCIEMEGAAVAQVCYEYDIPFAVIRTISDQAGTCAYIDFQRFISKVATLYAEGIIHALYQELAQTNIKQFELAHR